MSLTHTPLATDARLDHLAEKLSHNVPDRERTVSLLGGALLAGAGVAQRSLGGLALAALGGALIYRGVTGNCQLYRALGIHSRAQNETAGVPENGVKTVETVTVQRPRAELYRHWRDFAHLPQFMSHLERVEVLDNRRSRWVVRTIAGQTVEWLAEIINERENEMIAWQSLPGADVANAGSVWFEDEVGGGTRVRVTLEYAPPAGTVGNLVARLFGEAPEQQLREDLAQWKSKMEKAASAPAMASV